GARPGRAPRRSRRARDDRQPTAGRGAARRVRRPGPPPPGQPLRRRVSAKPHDCAAAASISDDTGSEDFEACPSDAVALLALSFFSLRAARRGSTPPSLRVVPLAPPPVPPALTFPSPGPGSFQLYWALMPPPVGECERTAISISIWLTLAGTGSS